MKEIAKNESGKILWEAPYPFKRLFAEGQCQVVGGKEYRIISCKLEGDTVETIVRELPR